MKLRKTFLSVAIALAGASTSLSASAVSIGLFGFNSNAAIESFLDSAGHNAVNFGGSVTAANLTGLDVAILLRTSGNADVTAFVNGGGRLITEWSAATYGMSLLGGTAVNAGFVANPDTISFTPAGGSISTGIGGSYSDRGRTDFFYDITNLGSGTLLAERSNGNDVLAYGKFGAGDVYVNGFDWADWSEFPLTDLGRTQQLLLNEIAGGGNGQVPLPGTLSLLGIGLAGIMLRRKKA